MESSSDKQTFSTGAQRDTQAGKLRYDLIPPGPLAALARVYTDGAAKYGEGNYQKGMPYMRVVASLLRHIYAWVTGESTERHMANVAWNAFALLQYEDAVKQGDLPAELDDRPKSEVWKAVVEPEFEELYQVSNWGRVRRTVQRYTDKPVLAACPAKNGYPQVTLNRGGLGRHCSVHRLVLEAFCGLPGPGEIALHADDVKTNNRIENLRWGTYGENYADWKRNLGEVAGKDLPVPCIPNLDDPYIGFWSPDGNPNGCWEVQADDCVFWQTPTVNVSTDSIFSREEVIQKIDMGHWVRCTPPAVVGGVYMSRTGAEGDREEMCDRLTPNPAFTNGLPLVPDTYAGYWTSVVKREENSVNGRTFICYQVSYGYQRRIVHDKNLTVIYGPWYVKTKSFIGLINEGRFIKYTGPNLEFIGRWNTDFNAAYPGEWQLDSYGVVRYRSPSTGTVPTYLSSETLIGGIRNGTYVRSAWKAGEAHKVLGFWKFRRQSVESSGCWEIRVDNSVWFYAPSGRRGPVRTGLIGDSAIEYIEKGDWEEYPDGKYLGFWNDYEEPASRGCWEICPGKVYFYDPTRLDSHVPLVSAKANIADGVWVRNQWKGLVL